MTKTDPPIESAAEFAVNAVCDCMAPKGPIGLAYHSARCLVKSTRVVERVRASVSGRDRAMMLRGARAAILAVRRAPSWSVWIDPETVIAALLEEEEEK